MTPNNNEHGASKPDALEISPDAVCEVIKEALINPNKTIFDEALVDFLRGYLKVGPVIRNRPSSPEFLDFGSAVVWLVRRFDNCLTVNGADAMGEALLYMLNAPLPVRQILHNAAFELKAQER